jgi:AraC family transcriptional regulator, regulatory protein of adaptative response / methylated-DNA-[protein]-cysteine methyltransferase
LLSEFDRKVRSASHLHPIYVSLVMNSISNTAPKYRTDEQRWRALLERDGRADGYFVYSVATTGVYCRPACPSRLAGRENVRFHETCANAERAGFRPCKRCQPNGPSRAEQQKEMLVRACRMIEETESTPNLTDLAKASGLSAFHFQRLFKAAVGVSPREYAAAQKNRKARAQLRKTSSVTEAIYSAGYSSSSRFYEAASKALGMKPSAFRSNGEQQQIEFAIERCSLGLVLIAGTARGICSVRFGKNLRALETELREEFRAADISGGDAEFRKTVRAVLKQIDEPHRQIQLPLDIRGTAFQHRVWEALRRIPAGQTVTYTEIANRIGAPSAVRAVARACATNPVAVVVPCHRVLRKDTNLAGYRWGVERKRALLEKEKRGDA